MPIKPLLPLICVMACAIACGRAPARPEAAAPPPAAAPMADAIDLNTASERELERIPHVGGSLARAIVEFRTEHGPFRRVEELMLVDGISDARFRRIRDRIRVE